MEGCPARAPLHLPDASLLRLPRRGAWRSLVSALVWGTRGPEFKSRRPDRGKPRSGGVFPVVATDALDCDSRRAYRHFTVAVADLGVAMGPRNRRRLTKGGIALGLIAAAVAAGAFFIRSSSQTVSGASHHARSGASFNAADIYPGMSKAQLLRLAGQPAAKPGTCWLYHTDQEIGPPGHAVHLDALKACFFAGHVYDIRDKIDGNWAKPAPARLPSPVG